MLLSDLPNGARATVTRVVTASTERNTDLLRRLG